VEGVVGLLEFDRCSGLFELFLGLVGLLDRHFLVEGERRFVCQILGLFSSPVSDPLFLIKERSREMEGDEER